MFLLPALLSALTDLTILYVGLLGRHDDDGSGHGDEGFDGSNANHSSPPAATLFLHTLLFCSAVRLIVLLYPLSHHTLKGTRIPYQKIYYAFHGISLGSTGGCLVWLLIIAEEHTSSGGWRLRVELEPDGLPSGLHPFLKGRGDGGNVGANSTVPAKLSKKIWTFLRDEFGGFVHEEVGDSRDDYDDEDDVVRELQLEQQSLLSSILIDHLWIISVLSLLSTTFHTVILMHVRSTAPMEYSIVRDDNRRKDRKVMAYYAYRQYYNSNGDGGEDAKDTSLEGGVGIGSPSKNTISKKRIFKKKTTGKITYNSIPTDDTCRADGEDAAIRNVEELGGRMFRRSGASARSSIRCADAGPVIVTLPNDSRPSRPSQNQSSRGNNSFGSALGPRYDDIMSDLQHRLDSARRQWSARLEDVQRNLNAQIHGGDGIDFALDSGGSDNRPTSPLRGLSPPITSGMGRLIQLSPFQALLQLYAYEDVIGTGKLDHAFGIGKHYDEDSATALVFYAPQLLSFLLHGAFLSSPHLERWILDCCRRNIRFAHRCFWFLRSWALGQGKFWHSKNVSDDDSTVQDVEAAQSLGALNIVSLPSSSLMPSLPKRYGSETNLYLVDCERKSEGAKVYGERSEYIRRNSKFPIEEHRLIEDLLQRIIECGGEATMQLRNSPFDAEHTPANGETTNFATGRASPYQSTDDLVRAGMVPIDAAGKPSDAHLRALRSSIKGKYKFQPRDQDEDTPDTELDQFLSTPKFLDALTALADDLMLVEKADRTKELRDRLKLLEVELLPSNVIYLPSAADVHHQIWRAVPEESVALSTNERVPCIITVSWSVSPSGRTIYLPWAPLPAFPVLS
jgi:hypothetical protein